jgi:hypothetical protein
MRKLAALTFLLLTSCIDLFGNPSRDEVAWANSPDQRTHAILIETNGGATTSYGYLVELHPGGHGGEPPVQAGNLYGATRSACAYGVDLRWRSPNNLALRFDSAEQIDVPATVVVGGKRIRLTVERGTVNPNAACGGMAASLPET